MRKFQLAISAIETAARRARSSFPKLLGKKSATGAGIHASASGQHYTLERVSQQWDQFRAHPGSKDRPADSGQRFRLRRCTEEGALIPRIRRTRAVRIAEKAARRGVQ